MKLTALIPCFVVTVVTMIVANPAIATVPYTENFTSSVANWADGSGLNLANFAPSGGPDGSSYASTAASVFNLANDVPVVLFRGQDEFNSSNHAFEGNWFTSGINRFSAYVRHSAPVSLPYFVRFATPSNSPATAAQKATLVAPNTWTKLSFDIVPSNVNLELFPEGPPSFFGSTFSNVGHIQVGFSVPTGLGINPDTFTFGLDKPSIAIVPEPASWLLSLGSAAIVLARRRRRIG